ncbi:MAG: MtrB/PioB family outer membrane beta-barrel protein [Acidobacteria bacterium]|nr:MtrB/PioB family outer membrane beta-barrel protein [Acidobacteriota bacterium]
MKRTMIIAAFFAMGLLVANSFAAAQDAPPTTSGGQVTLGLLGAGDISSSKFQEYREVPKGVSIPFMNLFSKSSTLDFNLVGYNVRQGDQRYMGWANLSWMDVAFDYNQIPHNMGNNAHMIWSETAPGVWSMSPTLRKTLADASELVPSASRTYDFYNALLTPTFNDANLIDLSSLRKRGDAEFDVSKALPFDLKFTYMREVKSGTRGQGGGDILGVVAPVVDVPEPLNDLIQDFGVRAAYNFNNKMGNVHAAFNRNLYNNRAETLVLDNPFRPADVVYTTTSVPGGPGSVRFTTAPDNEASTFTTGVLLKFAHQTRLTGDVAMASWTQNAQFYPYTINSVVLTPAGARADSTSSLQQQSFNGKINTTTLNFGFSSRPVEGLGLRMRYRSYELKNKTNRFVITGDLSPTPDRSWGAADAPSVDAPYGHPTALNYDTKSDRFDASVSYDVKALTLEGAYRYAKLTRTYREAASGKDNGYSFSALFHASDWLGFRGTYDELKRTASDYPSTTIGLMADEAERKTKRTGVDIELTPMDSLSFTFAYFRKNDDYPNRPGRVAGNLDTTSGLLFAKYDTYTGEFEFTPNERVELSAYYTYEKNLQTNRWTTLTNGAINNSLRYDGSDKTNTFGLNAVFHFVPEKWTCTLMARHQKVDGLMGVTANPSGSFYTSRATANPPGPQAITDWDDTELTTIGAQLDYAVAKAWTLGAGYMYEKYDYADAYTSGTTLMPFSVSVFMKADSGPYKANVVYTKLTVRF